MLDTELTLLTTASPELLKPTAHGNGFMLQDSSSVLKKTKNKRLTLSSGKLIGKNILENKLKIMIKLSELLLDKAYSLEQQCRLLIDDDVSDDNNAPNVSERMEGCSSDVTSA